MTAPGAPTNTSLFSGVSCAYWLVPVGCTPGANPYVVFGANDQLFANELLSPAGTTTAPDDAVEGPSRIPLFPQICAGGADDAVPPDGGSVVVDVVAVDVCDRTTSAASKPNTVTASSAY